MSNEILKPVLLDETGKQILTAILQNNAMQTLVAQINSETAKIKTSVNSINVTAVEETDGHVVLKYTKTPVEGES